MQEDNLREKIQLWMLGKDVEPLQNEFQQELENAVHGKDEAAKGSVLSQVDEILKGNEHDRI